jgi:hypothetical protein
MRIILAIFVAVGPLFLAGCHHSQASPERQLSPTSPSNLRSDDPPSNASPYAVSPARARPLWV